MATAEPQGMDTWLGGRDHRQERLGEGVCKFGESHRSAERSGERHGRRHIMSRVPAAYQACVRVHD